VATIPNSPTEHERLEYRVAELENRSRFGGYARLYGPMAVLFVALSFLPLFDNVVSDNLITRYGTIWEMAGRNGGDPAVFGIFLMMALVGMLVTATFRVRGGPGLPLAIAADAGLIALMMLSKPGTGEPTPDLSDSGMAGLAIVLSTIVLACVHALHLRRYERRGR
jgi:hypothetical protein